MTEHTVDTVIFPQNLASRRTGKPSIEDLVEMAGKSLWVDTNHGNEDRTEKGEYHDYVL